MAIVPVGTVAINPNFDELGVFPPVPGLQGGGRLFILELLSPVALSANTYFLIIPGLSLGTNLVELLPVGKFFPKGVPLVFSVGLPDAAVFNSIDLLISLFPKNRFRGPVDNQVLNLRLSYEDTIDVGATASLFGR